MKNAKLVAWGIVISLVIALLTALELIGEGGYTLAGFGYVFFGIWAAVILFKNASIDSNLK